MDRVFLSTKMNAYDVFYSTIMAAKSYYKKIAWAISAAITLISCEPVLQISDSSFEVTSDGLKTTIGIDINNSWTASSSADWCVLLPTNGDKSIKSLSLTVKRNFLYEDRECFITIQSKNKKETIVVKQDQLDGIILETSSLYLSDTDQYFDVSFDSNVNHNISVSCDWIKYVETKALTHNTLVFHAEENTSTELRTGSICISSQDDKILSYIYVEQKQRDYISPSSDSICFEWEASTIDLPVEANVDFEIVIPEDCGWLHIDRKGGMKEYVLNVSVDAFVPTPATTSDLAISDRSCMISLQSGSISKEITVTQRFLDYIWISQDKASLYVGESVSIKACAVFHDDINHELHWSSDNESVAIVTDAGVIYAEAKGSATITVFNADKSYCAKVPVTVKKQTDDIYVSAIGASISPSYVVYQSRIYWPSQINSIKFLSVWLCYPDGTAYDIQGTRDGYVLFKPIHYSGSWDNETRAYYSKWFVVYQIEVDGEFLQYSSYVNPNVFSSLY